MNNMMRKGLLAGLFFFIQLTVFAQFTGSLPVVQATPGSQVIVPVQVSQMAGVQAFNIGIRFDAAVLTFNSVITNGHPLQGTLTQSNLVGNEVRVVYVGSALNLGTDTLFEIAFTYNGAGGVSPLLWNREYTEFTGANSSILSENLANGALYATGITAAISATTGDATACELASTSLGVTASNATAFQWQVSTDGGATFSNVSNGGGVSGATTATLQLSTLSITANGHYYHCVVTGTGGNALSPAQRLRVNAVSGVSVTVQAQPAGAVCAGTQVTYRANTGSTVNAPQYVWRVNGQPAGTDSVLVRSNLAQGDVVSVDISSGTGCISGSGNATAQVSALPTAFSVGGGGGYCVGGSGVQINLSGSQSGVTYRLLRHGQQVDSLSGTGNQLQFSARTDSGTYSIVAVSSSGCTQSMTGTRQISINALPIADAGNDTSFFVGNSVQLRASGGTSYSWSPATGLSATNVFNPIANPQQTTRYYVTVTNLFGCTAIDSVLVTVNQLPVVSAGNDTAVCVSAANFNLVGSPNGGSWSGTGIVSASTGLFSPSLALTGAKTLVYTVTDGVNYTITDTVIVTVNALPVVTFTSPGNFCANDTAVVLTGGTPAGGSYSGTGVSNGRFNPQVAGLGNHKLFYHYTHPQTACSNVDSVIVSVSSLPTVDLGNFAPVCVNSDSLELAGGTPIGGTYSGPGVRNGYFFPTTAGLGTHFIVYTYQNPQTGCVNSDSGTINVGALPSLVFPPLGTTCINQQGFALTTGSPAGGNYSGTGVNNNQFLPQQAGLGTFTITYTYTDTLTGCSNSISSTITVNDVPAVTLAPINAVCVSAAPFALTGGSPAGGSFSGPGVSNGVFNPFAAGAGTHAIVYSYTDPQTGCAGTATRNMVVTPGPGTTLTALNSTTFCAGGSVILQAAADTGTSFVWLRNGLVIAGQTSANFMVSQSGTYRAIGTSNASGCTDSSQSIVVTVNPLPGATVTATGSTTFCAGGSVVLRATPSTGMSYVWLRNGVALNGQTTDSIIASQSGAYRVIVTNTSTQCFDTSSAITVTANSLPGATISAAGPTTFCAGGLVVLRATPASGMTYTWLRNGAVISGQTADTLIASQSGAYRVRLSSTSTQCFDTSATTTVTVNPLPGAAITAAGATTFCQGGSVVLNATPATGMSYVWLRNGAVVAGQTAASLTASLAGAYRVIVTNTSTQCFDTSATTTVTVNPLPGAAITAVGSTTFCQGGSVVLNATPATGMSYVWLRNGAVVAGQTAASLTASLAGAYRVIVTNTSTQCFDTSATTTVTVNPLPGAAITAAGATTFCQGGSVVLNATPATGMSYVWLRNGAVVVGQTAASLTVTQAGAYRVRVTNTSTQCFDTSAVTTVTVNPLPGAAITAAGATTFCQGGSVVLNATPATGMSYVWLRNGAVVAGQTAVSLTATLAGAYRVIVTNTSTQCFDTSATTTVTVNALPTATITPVGSTTICDGSAVTLNANTGTGLTYAWLRNGVVVAGQTAATLSATQAGAYRVIVTNSSSCFDTSAAVTVTVNPRPAAPVITVSATADTLFSSVATGNQWFRNGVAVAGATSQTLVITQNGIYRAVVTNTNNCTSDSSNALNILNVSVAGQTFGYLNVYPNPTSGKAWLQVELPLFEEVRIEVLSSTGQRVHYEWLAANSGALQHELQLPALADGVYLVRVQQGEYVGVKRLMVRK
ncbi:MAG: hypothetical protein C0424_00010 [Sphingobacteriaceae bacterium]|nr:hypothetical protein [Sphingobacteriaceae bacterium]